MPPGAIQDRFKTDFIVKLEVRFRRISRISKISRISRISRIVVIRQGKKRKPSWVGSLCIRLPHRFQQTWCQVAKNPTVASKKSNTPVKNKTPDSKLWKFQIFAKKFIKYDACPDGSPSLVGIGGLVVDRHWPMWAVRNSVKIRLPAAPNYFFDQSLAWNV